MQVRSNNNFKPNNSSNKCPKREWYDTWLDAVNEKVLYLQLCIKAYEVYFYNNKGKLQYLYFQQNTLIKVNVVNHFLCIKTNLFAWKCFILFKS